MSSFPQTSPFPLAGLLSKETQADSFIARTGHNGRGIRVAVLDTGVDPATHGLSHCIHDLIDCTSAGDVSLKPVEPLPSPSTSSDKVYLPSPSGRIVTASTSWKNPTGKWKTGYKRAWEFWPDDLISRRKKERASKLDLKFSELLAGAHRELAVFERQQSEEKVKKSDKGKESKEYISPDGKKVDVEAPGEGDKERLKLVKKDLEDRISAIQELSKTEDAGPVIDVISWHDGEHLRAVIGGGEGEQETIPILNEDMSPFVLDLSKIEPMTDFKTEKKYQQFGTQDLLSYSYNFYEEGDILSIVTLSGSHGSHVASIIASQHKEQPEINGIAPGVEIVSLRIGDPRVSGMETHQALLRASKAILDSGCDIANMSFGEDSAWLMERKGAFLEQLVQEVVRKRDVIFVTSAGNAGPALSTVGSPAAGDALVTIGAYETPSMQASMYALLDKVPASTYTWSSRGPTADGAVGVTCFAPGAAITGVPTYNLHIAQLMNGTSMSSPSACGAISLLLSALKADKIPWTPARVKKAIEATSKDIGDPLNTGLLQVEKAYDYLLEHQKFADEDAEWEVQVTPTGRGEAMRGVYLREAYNTDSVQQFQVQVTPKLKETETKKLYDINLDCTLSASASWVSVPQFVAIQGNGRTFAIKVDPTQLDAGLNTAQIKAFAGGRTLFSIPVTVVRPAVLTSPVYSFSHSYTSGTIKRHFVAVPEGAVSAELKITSAGHATPIQFWMHCVQVLPHQRLSKTENAYVFSLANAGEPITRKMAVTGGSTLELCATQAWNAIGRANIEVTVDFHGLHSGHDVLMLGEDELRELPVRGSVRPENLDPSIKFESRRKMLRPKSSKINSLSARNNLPSGKSLYQLKLTYDVKLSKKSSITPRFATSNHLYDGPFGVMMVLTDKNGRVVRWLDMYDKEIADLDKGDYTMCLSLLHQDVKVLEKQKGLVMALDAKLEGKAKGLAFNLYRDRYDGLTAEKPNKFTNVKVRPGELRSIVVKASIPSDASGDLYKDAAAGDLLVGKFALSGDASKLGRAVYYTLPPRAPEDKKEDEEKDEEKQLLVDLRLEMAKKIKDESEKTNYLDTLLKDYTHHLPLLVAKLESLKDETGDRSLENQILKAADSILAEINVDDLARANGLPKKSNDTAEERKAAKKTTEQKAALLLAYNRKVKVLFARESNDESHETSTDDSYEAVSRNQSPISTAETSDYAAVMHSYRQWVECETSDNAFALQAAKDHMRKQRYGTALQVIAKLLENLGDGSGDKIAKEARALKAQAVGKLEWRVLVEMEQKRKLQLEPQGELIF